MAYTHKYIWIEIYEFSFLAMLYTHTRRLYMKEISINEMNES